MGSMGGLEILYKIKMRIGLGKMRIGNYIPLWGRVHRRIRSRGKKKCVVLYGREFFLDPCDENELSHGGMIAIHKGLHAFLTEYFLPGEYAIDVGAHIGYFTLLFWHLGAKEVLAFEPDEGNYRLLLKNTEGLENISCYPIACGRTSGSGTLHRNSDSSGDHSLISAPFRNSNGHCVAIEPLSKFLHLKNVCWIKIDVQGYEREVLAGIGKGTSAHICMEWWPYGLALAGVNAVDFLFELRATYTIVKKIDNSGFLVNDSISCDEKDIDNLCNIYVH